MLLADVQGGWRLPPTEGPKTDMDFNEIQLHYSNFIQTQIEDISIKIKLLK